jgi:membrane-bound lytic murein transglycosylase D
MDVSKLFVAASLAALAILLGCEPQQAAASPLGQAPKATAPTPAQAQAPPASPADPNAHRDQQLIDSVEQAYRAGLTNYQASHLEAAKNNFDYAVDLLLSSGYDLKNDPQLSAEFDHIVDAINTIEMEALKQGNGFEPRTESTPVDVANDVTFAVDPKLKALAQADLQTTQSDLPLVLNDYVASYINFFTNTRSGHATIVNSLTRAGKYKQMIQRILAEEGVPQDLIYQAVAESGFQVRVMNGRGSGAGGMWQFMPGDAFAPPRSAWFDYRFDPEQSTRAYARYIKYLYKQLGDWYLAMAAYDWGAGNVQRAVQRTGYADFWELYRRNVLPQETKNYVPIIPSSTVSMESSPIRPSSPIASPPTTASICASSPMSSKRPCRRSSRSIPASSAWPLRPTIPLPCICRRAPKTSTPNASPRYRSIAASHGASTKSRPEKRSKTSRVRIM